MGYIRSGVFGAGRLRSISCYILVCFTFGFLLPLFSLIGVIRRGGPQVRATQTVLIGVGWDGTYRAFLSGFDDGKTGHCRVGGYEVMFLRHSSYYN